MKQLSAHSYVAPYNLAAIYAGLGEKDQAFAWLDRAYADRSGFLAFYFTTDTVWTTCAPIRALLNSCAASDCRNRGE